MAMQTNPIITSNKRQLKCGRCTNIGRRIKSCTLNFENVRDIETAAFRDCFRQSKTQHNLM